MTAPAEHHDGYFPGLRDLSDDARAAVIDALFESGFFGDLTRQQVEQRYIEAPVFGKLRCAMPEQAKAGACKWPMTTVAYRQAMSLPGLTREQVAAAYKQACDGWNAVCGINLVPHTSGAGPVNIDAVAAHIDGNSGTLAYSYLPCNSTPNSCMGQVYDHDESWEYNWLVEVAMHEVGHAIGLDHSTDPDALMYPYSHGGLVIAPQDDDILQAQKRYGPPAAPPEPEPEPPQPGEPPAAGPPVAGGILVIKWSSCAIVGGTVLIDGVKYNVILDPVA